MESHSLEASTVLPHTSAIPLILLGLEGGIKECRIQQRDSKSTLAEKPHVGTCTPTGTDTHGPPRAPAGGGCSGMLVGWGPCGRNAKNLFNLIHLTEVIAALTVAFLSSKFIAILKTSQMHLV